MMKTTKILISLLLALAITVATGALFIAARPFGALAEDPPKYYLICRQNDMDEADTSYELTLDSAVTEYEEYTVTLPATPTTDGKYTYYIISDGGDKYYPNAAGVVDLIADTPYAVKFSPTHEYSSGYYTTVVDTTEPPTVYDYYVLSPANDYAMDAAYKMTVRTVGEGDETYDEYFLPLSLTADTDYTYYIYANVVSGSGTDARYYPNDSGVVALSAGEYEIRYSPSHSYGTVGSTNYYTTVEPTIALTRYYLICRENDMDEADTSYELTLDEEITEYEEYTVTLPVTPSEDVSYSYYIISDGGDKFKPNASGIVTLSADTAYTVKFSPSHEYSTGYYTTVVITTPPIVREYYFAKSTDGYAVDAVNKLAKNETVDAYEEYTLTITLDENSEFAYYICGRAEGEDDVRYYPNSSGTIKLDAGSYTVRYSPDHVYYTENDVNYYTAVEPSADEYYVICAASRWKVNADYRMVESNENPSFREFTFTYNVNDATWLSYYIYAPASDTQYYPNDSGLVELSESGDWIIKFSPSHSYLTENRIDYYTTAEIAEYDGYYLLCNLNDYRYIINDADYREKYRFADDITKEGFSYKLTLDVTPEDIDEYEKVGFYISNGPDRYRAGGDTDFVITGAGSYEIYFSPASDDEDEESTAAVYVYIAENYLRGEPTDELRTTDAEDNYVYVGGDGLTDDMVLRVLTSGMYKYIEITLDGKVVDTGELTVTYYVGDNPEDYAVSVYENKSTVEVSATTRDRYVVFKLKPNQGFIIEQRQPLITTFMLIIIICSAFLGILVLALIIARLRRRTRV